MKYVRSLAHLRITYDGSVCDNLLTVYCDSDFVMHLDDRKSSSNFVVVLNGGPVA